jgi:D-alanine-D-alanine ligase
MKVMILYDRMAEKAADPDQADALVQAKWVQEALRDLGHEPASLGIDLDFNTFRNELKRIEPDLVFNLVESIGGHGRLIHFLPTLLELIPVPYTGSPADALYVTSNKLLTKKILRSAGIRNPVAFLPEESGLGDPLSKGIYIIKSVWEHASIGMDGDSVLFIEDPQQLLMEMERRRQRLGGDCFAERYIEGREFNLSLLADCEGPEVLPPAEILFHDYPEGKWKILDYGAKWDQGSFEYAHTKRRFEFPEKDQAILADLARLARTCWERFKLRGYARIDFRVDKDGVPWVLEINANPCLSPDAGFFAAAARGGLQFHHVVERIIGDAKG